MRKTAPRRAPNTGNSSHAGDFERADALDEISISDVEIR
jgi:hypothetical protein